MDGQQAGKELHQHAGACQAECGRQRREHGALHHPFPNQTPARGAQRLPNCRFVAALFRAGQQDAGHIGARHGEQNAEQNTPIAVSLTPPRSRCANAA